MPTIKDIAQLAGVSHGTVSNVLNGKGNVSLKKVRLVEAAAQQLGYIINRQAKNLRKAVANVLAVIIPHLHTPEYVEFYNAIRQTAEASDYKVQLFLTDDLPVKELEIVRDLDIERLHGVAVITCLPRTQADIYKQLENKSISVIFAERRPKGACGSYFGFDFQEAGARIAEYITKQYPDAVSVGLLTLSSAHSSEADFSQGFRSALSSPLNHVKTAVNNAFVDAFSFFEGPDAPEVIVTTHLNLALSLQNVYNLLDRTPPPAVISLAQSGLNPYAQVQPYGLNFGQLGHAVCKQLLDPDDGAKDCLLPQNGFARKYASPLLPNGKTINLITLDSPATQALRQLLPDFTKKSGITVNCAVFSHGELYNIISNMKDNSLYDVIRLDVVWLSWFAERVLAELDFERMGFDSISERVIPNVLKNYSMVNGKYYALPFDLCIQLLFYRKDLFESPKIKRMYYEQTKSSLEIPTNYRQFNDVSAFFTKSLNGQSPIPYGTSMPIGGYSVITVEFLSRLWDLGGAVFDKQGNCLLDSETAAEALRSYKAAFDFSCPVPGDSWWNYPAQNFAESQSAQIIIFNNYSTHVLNSRSSKVLGNIGYAPVPGNHPSIGGGTLGISKYSQKQSESVEFLKWVSSEEIATAFSFLGGVAPYKSIFLNSRLLSQYPWLTSVRHEIEKGQIRRLLERPTMAIEEKSIEDILGMAIKNYLMNITDERQTLLQAKIGIDQFRKPFLNR